MWFGGQAAPRESTPGPESCGAWSEPSRAAQAERSRRAQAGHAELAALDSEVVERQAAREPRRHGGPGRATPRSRLVRRLSGGLAELRTQLVNHIDRSWIRHSTAGQAGRVAVLLRLAGPQGHEPARGGAAPAQRVHVRERCSTARGGRAFSPSSIWPAVITSCGERASDRWKTSSCWQLGRLGSVGLLPRAGISSSLLMRVTSLALTVGLDSLETPCGWQDQGLISNPGRPGRCFLGAYPVRQAH
jgi:hypothetical protein